MLLFCHHFLPVQLIILSSIADTILLRSLTNFSGQSVRWPYGVCGRGVGSNSIQCTSCKKWVHRKCSGIKGSMYKVMKSFICRGCLIPVIGTGRSSADITVNANVELVDKFCYLGDMLRVDGDADAAVENRIQIGWNKFRQLVPLLTNKHISLTVRGRLYSSCVRSSMLRERLGLDDRISVLQ